MRLPVEFGCRKRGEMQVVLRAEVRERKRVRWMRRRERGERVRDMLLRGVIGSCGM